MPAPLNPDVKNVVEDNQMETPTTQGSDTGPATPTKAERVVLDISPEVKGVAQTPEQAPSAPVQPETSANLANSAGKQKPKYRFKERKLDQNGKKRNFYNPPGKVMRHLAQQSYYDNFYGNQGQFYTMKQKYKTQMCKHYLENNECPLKQFCQFAHGPADLRQPNDPLPKNFGKQALGAVYSNFKTEQCKIFVETGECKFGDGCSFYHSDADKRELTDPLPNVPEGVTLPPMPEKKHYRSAKAQYKGDYDYQNNGQSISPLHFSPMQPQPMIQLSSLADIVALGGFNPNKYMSPPEPFGSAQPFYGQAFGAPQPVGGFNSQEGANVNPTPFVPKSKAYKKDKSPSGSNKNRKEKNTAEKKYSPKKKETTKPAAEATPAQQ